jgi:hypothetical protein
MLNSIPELQNQHDYLKLIAAYNQAYKRANALTLAQSVLQFGLAVAVPALGVVSWFPLWGGVLFTLIVLLIDILVLAPMIKGSRTLGAQLQELFDTRLLELPWQDGVAGDQPAPEIVEEKYRLFQLAHPTNDLTQFKNWYPVECGGLPLPYARFVFQRSNMYWDAELRQLYSLIPLTMLFLLPLAGITFALLMQWTLAQFMLLIVAPLLPAIRTLHKQYVDQHEAASLSQRTIRILNRNWNEAIHKSVTQDVLLIHARHIQDELFTRRQMVSRIPTWFYKIFRDDFETIMKKTALTMVNEASSKNGSI